MTDQIQKEINAAGGNDAPAVKNAPAPAVKGKAKGKAKAKPAAKKAPVAKKEPTAKQLQAAADKAAAAEEKAAEKKAADAEKAAEKKEADAKKLTITTENKCKPLINAGLKAMHMVGNGNKGWTIAAFQLREVCKGTPVNFKDAMAEGWGVAKNTATKLANAGQLMHELSTSDEQDVRAQLEYMPMGSINNLSVLSGFSEPKMEKGIDLGVIKMDATEAAIAEFARDYNDKGVKMVIKTVPSTPAADAEDAAAEAGETVSESETPETVQAATARILSLTTSWTDDEVLLLIESLEAAHPGVLGTE